jgi:hypothetical protein
MRDVLGALLAMCLLATIVVLGSWAAEVIRGVFVHASARRRVTLRTASGVYFHPFDPRPEDIRPGDIARALSLSTRFCGHLPVHYSSAQHSVHVSRLVGPHLQLEALLHDAAEAYTGLNDLVGQVKRALPWPIGWYLRRHEARVERAIAQRFGIIPGFSKLKAVKEADRRASATEDRDLRHLVPENGARPDDKRIQPLEPWEAEILFLMRLDELGVDVEADLERLGAGRPDTAETPVDTLVDALLLSLDPVLGAPVDDVIAAWRDAVESWTPAERQEAMTWAAAEYIGERSGDEDVKRRPRPACIDRLPLLPIHVDTPTGLFGRMEVGRG